MTAELPSDVDKNLRFWSDRCNGYDYLFDSRWHTHVGRMSAYCPHDLDHPDYRVSLSELPEKLPSETKYWVQGFLAGNLPSAPDEEENPAAYAQW